MKRRIDSIDRATNEVAERVRNALGEDDENNGSICKEIGEEIQID